MAGTVCVIDDDVVHASIGQILHSAGFDYLPASLHSLTAAITANPQIIAFLVDATPDPKAAVKCCQMIRKISAAPILVVLSPDENPDLHEILSSGADDFVMLPVRPSELLLRLNVLLKRKKEANRSHPKKVLGCGELVIDVKDHRLWKGGEEITISPLCFQILAYFMEHIGEAVTKSDLVHHVWRYSTAAETSNLVETGIARLRKELGETPNNPVYIHTVWGKGYRFESKPLSESAQGKADPSA